jgi:hypothetical protein
LAGEKRHAPCGRSVLVGHRNIIIWRCGKIGAHTWTLRTAET